MVLTQTKIRCMAEMTVFIIYFHLLSKKKYLISLTFLFLNLMLTRTREGTIVPPLLGSVARLGLSAFELFLNTLGRLIKLLIFFL